MEPLSSDHTLSEHAPLSAFKKGKLVKVWNFREATRALRLITDREGVDSKRVSLHSLRIGTATVLAAGGEIAERVIQREGRWKSGIDTYKVYTRNNRGFDSGLTQAHYSRETPAGTARSGHKLGKLTISSLRIRPAALLLQR